MPVTTTTSTTLSPYEELLVKYEVWRTFIQNLTRSVVKNGIPFSRTEALTRLLARTLGESLSNANQISGFTPTTEQELALQVKLNSLVNEMLPILIGTFTDTTQAAKFAKALMKLANQAMPTTTTSTTTTPTTTTTTPTTTVAP